MEELPTVRVGQANVGRGGKSRTSMRLWLVNALLLAGALVLWQKVRWRKISDSPAGILWQRGHTIQTDRNRDGLVDEEIVSLPNGDKAITRDADLDGWFDFRYVERGGLARGLEQIHERVPSH